MAGLWLAAALLLAGLIGPARAEKPVAGSIMGKDDRRFGRMILTFPEPVSATVRVLGGVMVVLFDRPIAVPVDKIATQLPGYISAARADPDGRSLRFALNQPVRADLKDASEQLYVDLMPVGWRGPPPPLPSDVVASLARRARETREAIRAAEARKAEPVPWPLKLHVAESEGRMQLVLALPPGGRMRLDSEGARAEMILDGPVLLEADAIRSALAGRVADLEIAPGKTGGRIRFSAPDALAITSHDEDGLAIVDIARPLQGLPEKAGELIIPQGAAQAAPEQGPPQAAPAAGEKAALPQAPVAVSAVLKRQGEGLTVTLSPRVPLAAFERGGMVWLVLASASALTITAEGAAPNTLAAGLQHESHEDWQLLRLLPARAGAVALTGEVEAWRLEIGGGSAAAGEPLRPRRGSDGEGHATLLADGPFAPPIALADPGSGAPLVVVPMGGSVRPLPRRQRYVGFDLAASLHGLVVAPEAEDIAVTVRGEQAILARAGGLALSEPARKEAAAASEPEPMLAAGQWNDDRRGAIRETERALTLASATAPRYARTGARLRLAEFYLANGYGNEAAGVLATLAREDAGAGQGRQVQLLQVLAKLQRGDREAAARQLAQKELASEPEAHLWRAYLDTLNGRPAAALPVFRAQARLMDRLPDVLQAMLRPQAIDAALAGGDLYLAGQHLGDFERLDETLRDPLLVTLLAGRIAEADGRPREAEAAFQQAAGAKNRGTEAEARLARVLFGLAQGSIERKAAKAELETIAVIWRRGDVELKARARLAEMYTEDMEWREAFLQSRRASEILPGHPLTRAIHDSAARTFLALFLEGKDTRLSKVQALAILDEFRGLIPPGAQGDDVVSRLAERLYALDLIDQAADLIDYQVKNRLKGQARIKAATRLAMMQMANGRPQEALKALRLSRSAHLPEDLRRARALIEARALAEDGRGDLALDLLANEAGSDVERLRGDVYWKARRWAEAAAAYERALGERWTEASVLDEGERADLIRAAVAGALAGDTLGLDRLRGRYLTRIDDAADAETFKLVTLDHLSRPEAFRQVARSVAASETFDAFLAAYRKRYPEMAGQPKAKPGEAGG